MESVNFVSGSKSTYISEGREEREKEVIDKDVKKSKGVVKKVWEEIRIETQT